MTAAVDLPTGGWMGISDKYWLAALVPDQQSKVDGNFRDTRRRRRVTRRTTWASR